MEINLQTIEQKVASLITPVLEELGINLWGIKFIRNPKRPTLQIFIDKEEGVTVDDCQEVSLQINGILDVEDLFKSSYNLEVSSPGLDRILFTFEQLCSYLGKQISVEVSMPVGNRRRFRGLLARVEGDIIVMKLDDVEYEIAYQNVSKAQVIPVF